MCLYISPSQSQNEKDLNRWFRNRKKFVYVYKVLRKLPDEDFYRSPHFPEFIWDFKNQKIFQVDRPNKPTEEELRLWHIDYGLHTYTSFEIAKWNQGYNAAIVKFKVLKKDIIAIENDWDKKEYDFREAVCRKLTFVKVIENDC
jgi:hypothetical protein